MVINALICDDEQKYIEQITKYLEEYCYDHSLTYKLESFTDGNAAINSQNVYNLAFLDIEIGNVSSIFDGDRIRTVFTESGYDVEYRYDFPKNQESQNNEEIDIYSDNYFYTIYSEVVEDGERNESYYSTIHNVNSNNTINPTETNVASIISEENLENGNTKFSQHIEANKSHSSYDSNLGVECITDLETVRDGFDRLYKNKYNLELNTSYPDGLNNNFEPASLTSEIEEEYSYKELSNSEDDNIITSYLLSKMKIKYSFDQSAYENPIIIEYINDYYPDGKLKFVKAIVSEETNDIDGENNEEYYEDFICYYEYNDFGNISFEFNKVSQICCGYDYSDQGILLSKTNYLYGYSSETFEDYFYKLLSLNGIIESSHPYYSVSNFDINDIYNSNKNFISFNMNDNYSNCVTSVNINNSSHDILLDDLGQPQNYVFYDDEGNIVEGTCEWVGTLLAAFETDRERFEFTYDVNGYRTSKTTYEKNRNYDSLTQGAQPYLYVYQNTVFYNWENGLLQGIHIIDKNQPDLTLYTDIIYDINNSPIAIQAPSGIQYIFIKDVNGNIISLCTPEGESICDYRYDAYGNITLSPEGSHWLIKAINLAIAKYNPCSYKGALYDYDIGMYFTQGRYYSGFLGRYLNISNYDNLNFVSENPLTEPYVFSNNDPINMCGLSNDKFTEQNKPMLNDINITATGFVTKISTAFLSRSYCSLLSNQIVKNYGWLSSKGNYVFRGMNNTRIQNQLFSYAVGKYSEEALNRVNSVWGDGWLHDAKKSDYLYFNTVDTNQRKYKEIWDNAELIRKYAINKGVYIGL